MDELTKKIEKLNSIYSVLPKKAGVIAVNFFKERFREGAWLDKTKEKWKPRKRKENSKRGVLIKSGRLKRSIRVTKTTPESVTIGTDVPYAQIHNEGGKVDKTVQVSSHKVRAHSRKRKGRTEFVKAHQVKAHSRKMSFVMPRRQFMGQSTVLNKQIEEMLINEIDNCLK